MADDPPLDQPHEAAASEQRYVPSVERVYRTEAVEVTWQPELCIHYGACFGGLPRVFDPRRRPWVDPQAEPPERIAEVVSWCPTGALNVRWLDERAADAPDEAISLMPQRDGPLFVRGRIRILDRGGRLVREDTRMALCRCGLSSNKPFCDDSHYRAGFQSRDPQLDGEGDAGRAP